jgi:hypothetical protein
MDVFLFFFLLCAVLCIFSGLIGVIALLSSVSLWRWVRSVYSTVMRRVDTSHEPVSQLAVLGRGMLDGMRIIRRMVGEVNY